MPLVLSSITIQGSISFVAGWEDFTYGSHHPCVDAAKEASMQSCLIMISVSKKNPDNKNTPCVDALKLYQKVSKKTPDKKDTPCVDAGTVEPSTTFGPDSTHNHWLNTATLFWVLSKKYWNSPADDTDQEGLPLQLPSTLCLPFYPPVKRAYKILGCQPAIWILWEIHMIMAQGCPSIPNMPQMGFLMKYMLGLNWNWKKFRVFLNRWPLAPNICVWWLDVVVFDDF